MDANNPNPVNPLNPPATPVAQPAPVAVPQQSSSDGSKWTIITILLLLFFWPVGLLLMWLKTTWPKALKIGLTIFFLIGIVLGFLLVSSMVGMSSSFKNSGYTAPVNPTVQTTVPEQTSSDSSQLETTAPASDSATSPASTP